MKLIESYELINESSLILKEITNLYQDSLKLDRLPVRVQTKIKNFLENSRSSLDYAGHYIFLEYCSSHLDENNKKSISKKVYYPIYSNQGDFTKMMNRIFVDLHIHHPDIFKILNDSQPYGYRPQHLFHLKELVNENKHRNLSKQIKREDMTIDYMVDFQGNSLSGNVFKGNQVNIVYNGKAFNPHNALNSGDVKSIKALVTTEFVFSDLNINAIIVLQSIHSCIKEIIDQIELIINN